MENSQIKLIKDMVFLDMRAKIAEVLVSQGILDTRDGVVGWWVHSGVPTWISLYDILEEARA